MKYILAILTSGVLWISDLFAQSQWLGMYLKDSKVGYTQVETQPESYGYKISELTYIELDMMGAKRNLKSISQYQVDKNFELKNFTFELQTEAQKMLIRGELKNKNLNLSVKTGGKMQTKTLNVNPPVYPITILSMIANKFKTSPQKIEVFDPSIQAVNTATCKLLEKKVDSINVEITILNATSTAWIKKNGELLSENQPMGITLRREPREKAIQIGKISPEILTLYKVPVNKEIKNPRGISLLKLLINIKVLENEQQRFFGDTLLIETRGPGPAVRKKHPDITKYLEPTPFIQSNDEKILKKTKEVVAGNRAPWKKVEAITEWVATNVHDMPTVTIPSALDVLETMEGDCGEHSILFAAIARASKIPCDIVVGLVYTGDGFYYHAWNKVWVGRWVEVDPTFNQPIADATHIGLAEGGLEEQAKIMELVDKIKITVLEAR